MNIATKFNLRDVVVPIYRRYETIGDPCPVCDGTGRAKLVSGGTVRCPSSGCYAGKINRTEIHPWTVRAEDESAIGRIEVSLYASGFDEENTLRYMIDATGVGSGTLWGEDDLFASVLEAQAECDKRNTGVSA